MRVADQGHRRRRRGVTRSRTRVGRPRASDRTQPLTKTAGLSAGAVASGGSRFDGTARRSADAATAVAHLREGLSHGRVVGTDGGRRVSPGSAAMLARGAAAPCPAGAGIDVEQQHARARRYRGGRGGERRGWPAPTGAVRRRIGSGFSTRCKVITASPAETRAAASLPARPAGTPSKRRHAAAAPASATDTTSTTPGRSRASRAGTARGRTPDRLVHTAAADHQRGAQHRQQRRGAGVGGGRARTGCRSAGSGPARPIRRLRRLGAAAGATAGSTAPPGRRRPVPRPGWAAKRTPTAATCACTARRPPTTPPRPARGPPDTASPATLRPGATRTRRSSHAVPMISTGHTR